jgi:hypothetical protein
MTTVYGGTAEEIRAMDTHLQQIHEYESRGGVSAGSINDAAKSETSGFFAGNGNLGRSGNPNKWSGLF